MRINRYLAACGLGSRRAMDTLVASGRVRVNGLPPEGPGQPVDPARDRVTVDGRLVQPPAENFVFAFHKPVGVLTTMHDPEGRATVAEYIREVPLRLFPVGRLDMDSAGLLLFTNDGKLAHRLAHPRYGVEKEYRVAAEGHLTDAKIRALEEGIELEEGITSPARVLFPEGAVFKQPGRGVCGFHLVLHEGWNRQVRRMCAALDLRVIELVRVRCGGIVLGDLAPGKMRRLNEREYAHLRAKAGL